MTLRTQGKAWSLFLYVVLGIAGVRGAESTSAHDVILLNGIVYDGTGKPGVQMDVAIRDGRISKTGALAREPAARRIDVKGLVVAPGFIDLHAHLEPLLQLADCESAVRQGVTTSLGGPDGNSPLPLREHLAQVERTRVGMNVAFLAGHGAIRRSVMKLVDRAPTTAELAEMEKLVAGAMRDGAFGLSTGLKYLPGTFAKTEEIVALARVAAKAGGIYTSHLREEGLGLLPAVQEAIEIGRAAGIPIVLTHHKVVGKPSWGASVKTLALVDNARASGIDVMIDQYPYTASNTGISVLIPSWALAGGADAFKQRIAVPQERERIRADVVEAIMTDRGAGDVRKVQFASVPWTRDLEGRTLADWCVERRIPATPERAADLVIEAQANGGCVCIFHAMDDADVERIMRHPQTMVASDGRLARPGVEQPHPRCYGTFPRVLARYVREKHVLALETALHKMTGMPAKRLGLKDRGVIAEGKYADLVVFDPATISDEATFKDPHRYPKGIPFVFVNGIAAVDDGRFTRTRAGQVLRGPSWDGNR